MTKRFSFAALVLMLIAAFCFFLGSSFRQPVAEAERCTENKSGACVSVNALPEKILQFMQ